MSETPERAIDFWSLSAPDLLVRLGTGPDGLTSAEAARRSEARPKAPSKRTSSLLLLLAQFKSPIVLLLLVAAVLSFFVHDSDNALIILAILSAGAALSFWQERGSSKAVERLLALVETKSRVYRDGGLVELPADEVVPGDVVDLSAGSSVPGDALLLESKDLFVDEATLTGETFPVEKVARTLAAATPVSRRSNSLFMGTHVVSGTARVLVARVGPETEFGKISKRLRLRPPESEFERGIRRFGYLLLEVTLVLVMAIFAMNVFLERPVMEAFLFSLALAVGLTPQLLPAIVSVNLAQGAKRMAAEGVIVKRLASIENLGSMNVLCSDKTGTLTRGIVEVHSALDPSGSPSDRVLFHAYLNARYQSGYANPIDEAIRRHREFDLAGYRKLDEVPYDFIRKRLSVLVSHEGRAFVVTKGALRSVLAVCSHAEGSTGAAVPIESVADGLRDRWEDLSREGLRTLGVAYRKAEALSISKEQEREMTFLGFLVLHDPPKPDVAGTIEELRGLGVALKVITGDNPIVAESVCRQIGLTRAELLTGQELREMRDDALIHRANAVNLFAEVEPNQKERIILALRKSGNVVGYLGDGVNDASALHTADIGISVAGAADVAREAADIVLMENDLRVLVQGVRAGRTTFANTLKYVFMATSANFGNMFSVAGASLFLPFLPLLPKQILLTNLLTDFPEMAIATDSVDPELVERPHRWNIAFIRRFMITFGVLSSVFDFLTFGVLLVLFRASPGSFRTAWFVESVASAALVVLVIRSRRPFFRSRPGRSLFAATLAVVAAAAFLPSSPLARAFDFHRLPLSVFLALAGIVALYILSAELAKRWFYRRVTL